MKCPFNGETSETLTGLKSPRDTEKQRQSLVKAGRLHWLHWLIVGISLAITIAAWYITKSQSENKIKSQFEHESERLIEHVSERMQKYEDALWSGVAAIHSQSFGIDYYEWKRFANTLHIEKKYPGINGIGIIYYVPPEKLKTFIDQQKKNRPDFKIHPPHDKKEFWPITYIEPVAINLAAVGLDMAFEQNRYEAAKKARDTGTAQITGPIILVQDSEKTPGFLFYAPFYDEEKRVTKNDKTAEKPKKFSGLVYAPFIMKKLMLGTLEKDKRHVGLKILDGDYILYDEHSPASKDYDPNPILTKSITIDIYGRQWTFDIRSKMSFRQSATTSKPWIILIGGLIIDALLLTIFLSFANSNRRAIDIANKMIKKENRNAVLLNAIVDNAVDGLISINENGVITSYNKACEKMFQYKEEEVLGKNIKILMPAPYSNEHDEYIKNYLTTGKKKIIGIGREATGKRKDGTTFPMDLAINEVKIENSIIFSGIIRDITERKEAEAALISANEELEEFAYRTSHDLRAPLVSSVSLLGMAKDAIIKEKNDVALKSLDHVENSLVKLERLVKDILALTQTKKSEENKQEIEIETLVDDVICKLTGMDHFSRLDIQEDYRFSEKIFLEKTRLSQIAENLLSNAVKYQDEKVKNPFIKVSTYKEEESFVFSVEDNGLGVPEEQRSKLFQMFKRFHSKVSFGTGLGLYITKKNAEAMGGEILFIPLKKGSLFRLVVPLSRIKK